MVTLARLLDERVEMLAEHGVLEGQLVGAGLQDVKLFLQLCQFYLLVLKALLQSDILP